MMIRTFISLEIPRAIIDEIISIRNNLVPAYERIKWESIEKLHVTLKFLGETEQENIEKIFTSIKQLSTKYQKFDLQLDHFGFFKSNGVKRILWAGLKENFELENFVKEIDILCSEFGFEMEKRKFKPHITMLRIKNESIIKEVDLLDNYRLPELKFIGNKITMFQSILTKGGSIYKPIKSLLL
jgi:2'-5' RNA ligase